MKIAELKLKSVNELKKDLGIVKEELRELSFRVSQNQHKDVRDVREKRHLIARIMTLIKERERQNTTKKK